MVKLRVRLAVASLLVVSLLACSGPPPRPAEPTRPPAQPTIAPATPAPATALPAAPAKPTAPPVAPTPAFVNGVAEVAVSNVRENAFAVSWLTDRVMTGVVRYGPDGGAAQGTIAERPVEAATGLVHYVVLGHDTGASLAPQNPYWFEIVSADGGRSLHRGSMTTGRTLDTPPAAGGAVFGKIEGAGGKPAAGAVVLVSVKLDDGSASAPLSSVANERGEWSLVIQNARTGDLAQALRYRCGDKLELQALAGPAGRASLTVDVCARPPLPPLSLP